MTVCISITEEPIAKYEKLFYQFLGRLMNRFANKIINLLILFSAVVVLISGISWIIQSYATVSDLVSHKGVIEKKQMDTVLKENSYDLFVKIKLVENDTIYTVSQLAEGVYNILEAGDSVEIFTKPVTAGLGNVSTDGKGGAVTTRDPNAVFHLTTPRYDEPIVDYRIHNADSRTSGIVMSILSFIFFGWYWYRRSGRKFPHVTETMRFD